jgi:hypothetical protein
MARQLSNDHDDLAVALGRPNKQSIGRFDRIRMTTKGLSIGLGARHVRKKTLLCCYYLLLCADSDDTRGSRTLQLMANKTYRFGRTNECDGDSRSRPNRSRRERPDEPTFRTWSDRGRMWSRRPLDLRNAANW